MVWQLMCTNIGSSCPLLITVCYRAASKDIELENNYLTLLKETSQHEKAIARDLGRLDP